MVWVGDGDHREVLDPREVAGVAGVKREIVRYGDRTDHGVVGACGWFSSCSSQPSSDPTEAAGGRSVERQRVEVSFGLLEVCLAGGPLVVGRCHEWTYREFGQSDRCDHRLVGKRIGGLQPTEQDECAGIEDPARHGSECWIEDLVEVVTQLVGVDSWKLPAAGKDHFELHRLPAKGAQFGHRLSGAGDRESFAFGCSVYHVAAMVAEFPDRDFGHAHSVSRVIHQGKGRSADQQIPSDNNRIRERSRLAPPALSVQRSTMGFRRDRLLWETARPHTPVRCGDHLFSRNPLTSGDERTYTRYIQRRAVTSPAKDRSEKTERINVRLSVRQRELIHDAAELAGTSMSEFIIVPAVERAATVLASDQVTRLNADVADKFIAWMDEPARVIPEMKRLVDAEPFED